MKKYNCVFIVGPTATGKTSISVSLAKLLNGEIINADSTQVYKNLNIGTAKATKQEQAGIKHHLIDIKNPTEEFSVSEFREMCLEICKEILNKNKTPIIVGGTGFYFDSLVNNYSYGNVEKNIEIRRKYEKLAKEKGKDFVHNILSSYDAESAKKLHPNDVKRVIRAIEIFETTGKTKAELTAEQNTMQTDNNSFLKPLIVGLNADRKILYERINERTDLMISAGLINEARKLYDLGLGKNLQSIKSIGYKELYDYFSGVKTLPECIEIIKKNTRNYAKRQITWFKKMKNIIWFDVIENDKTYILNEILSMFK